MADPAFVHLPSLDAHDSSLMETLVCFLSGHFGGTRHFTLLLGLLHCHTSPLCRKNILSKTEFSGARIAIVRETILGKIILPNFVFIFSLLCKEKNSLLTGGRKRCCGFWAMDIYGGYSVCCFRSSEGMRLWKLRAGGKQKNQNSQWAGLLRRRTLFEFHKGFESLLIVL